MTRVAVALLQKDGKVLLCQRKKGSRYGLKWEFPGGKLEEGESTLDCLRRELREELSIEIQNIDRIETHQAQYDDGAAFEVSYCFVSEFSGAPWNNAFQEIRWVTLTELKVMDVLEGNRPFITTLDRW
ncbi:MAG: (deoxy)nucleoside triphosphate pyrophosphohydrolase [Ignavibacteria bacterium]|nr:(deoxy)nucleoside triphosphate pyrophosphohydrolase [Ignavibacteria bacterium]